MRICESRLNDVSFESRVFIEGNFRPYDVAGACGVSEWIHGKLIPVNPLGAFSPREGSVNCNMAGQMRNGY